MARAIAIGLMAIGMSMAAFAQPLPNPVAPQPPAPPVRVGDSAQNPALAPNSAGVAEQVAEQQELAAALTNANQSAVDVIRILEDFLKVHPQTAQRKDILNVLARASIDGKDDRRTVLYGQQVLVNTPDDVLILDRVTRALLALGGKENAAASLPYSVAFSARIMQEPAPEGKDAARKQEERDRALARALVYQARAKSTVGENAVAEALAAKAFATYASEESAREWGEILDHLGRTEEALERWSDAFAIPDARAADADRAADRKQLGDVYRKLHGSEKGLGDLILAAYDRTATLIAERAARLRALEPNSGETEAMRFTLTGLDGKKLTLASLKGSIVVLDFWATWCGPCRIQHPLYEEVKQRFKDRTDVVFLAIDADEDRSLVAPFLDQIKWTRASVYFEDGLQRLLQVTSIPTTVLFDKQGHLMSRMTGFLPDKFVDQLSERIKSALAE